MKIFYKNSDLGRLNYMQITYCHFHHVNTKFFLQISEISSRLICLSLYLFQTLIRVRLWLSRSADQVVYLWEKELEIERQSLAGTAAEMPQMFSENGHHISKNCEVTHNSLTNTADVTPTDGQQVYRTNGSRLDKASRVTYPHTRQPQFRFHATSTRSGTKANLLETERGLLELFPPLETSKSTRMTCVQQPIVGTHFVLSDGLEREQITVDDLQASSCESAASTQIGRDTSTAEGEEEEKRHVVGEHDASWSGNRDHLRFM